MIARDTWIAEDLAAPVRARRRVAWAAGLLSATAIAATLFLVTSPVQVQPTLRDPGVFGVVASADLLPGFALDEERRLMGPARLVLGDGRPAFLPARTPFSGASPCTALRPPEDDAGDVCHVYLWFEQDGRTVRWLTQTREGGPGEALLDGRLLAASPDGLVLDDGSTVIPRPDLRLAECPADTLGDLVGQTVVVSLAHDDGRARQVTCRV